MQPQPLLVFPQCETVSNNKRDKTKSCKHQRHESIFVGETDKYKKMRIFILQFDLENPRPN